MKKGQKGSGLFSGPSSRSGGTFEVETNGAAFDPAVVSKGEAALNAVTQRFDFETTSAQEPRREIQCRDIDHPSA
jgi:hypothetical protein